MLFSARRAYMRDYRVIVPADCIASNRSEENESALAQMQAVLKADITPSTALALEEVA